MNKNFNVTKKILWLLAAALCPLAAGDAGAQDKLYANTFPLGSVRLLEESPFRHSCDLNIQTLLKYDTDRLLAPYLKEAGLPKKAECFPNWDGLDGHVGGHYLTALAIHYAATGNSECLRRMNYMVDELERCQKAHGNGYVGGVPNGMNCWDEIKKGNVGIVWKFWVPWYNVHKTYAGLRDAWLYGGNEKARRMFLDFCDWGLTVIAPLSDTQMEQMLDNEFGGMDEVYADAYQMTDDAKYLDAAKRFSHHWLLDSMAEGKDNLDNRHANTQVPKVVGYQRIAELSAAAGRTADRDLYKRASEFFWHTVVDTRSLALGGNSRREHFAAADDCISYVDDREGPESCNTNNMMKLTEGLFRMTPDAAYADFYERAMLNHILSTQHPEHGGYVYFTPARPAHYRVYSAPNSAMWCCVGTGMENHGKYGEFIYTHAGDSLFVNLFTASELDWKERGLRLTQQTTFPYSDKVRLTVNVRKPVRMKLLIRHPQWCEGGAMTAVCRGKDYAAGSAASSYFVIDRKWKDGDVIELTMPMTVRIEELPNVPNYIAVMRGPVLLGARMGTEGLTGLVADDSRWGHIAHGPLVSIFDTPVMVGDRSDILKKLNNMQPVAGKPMCYTVPGLFDGKFKDLVLEPFFSLHDCRYMMYWLSMTEDEYARHKAAVMEQEHQKLELDRRTVDAVIMGEQQPEADHYMVQYRTSTGNTQGEAWREARDGGYFEYKMNTEGLDRLILHVRCRGSEAVNQPHGLELLIDGKVIAAGDRFKGTDGKELIADGKGLTADGATQNVEYSLPAELLKDKKSVTVTFRSRKGTTTGKILRVRLLKPQQK